MIPAGVAHKNLGSTADFGVAGAYPEGQDWDINYGWPGGRPHADNRPFGSMNGPMIGSPNRFSSILGILS